MLNKNYDIISKNQKNKKIVSRNFYILTQVSKIKEEIKNDKRSPTRLRWYLHPNGISTKFHLA